MRRVITITALSLTLCGVAGAQDDTVDNRQVYYLGIAHRSCAFWLESVANQNAGNHWIGGFWTGLNVYSLQDVGHTIDPEGVFGEIEKVCRENPSMHIITATRRIYEKMEAQHR
jgi:hypothetical protein